MKKHITKFNTHVSYEEATLDYPNVSLITEDDSIVYLMTDPSYNGFCRLTLNDDSVVEIEGSGELTEAMITSYTSTVVMAEIGTQCTSIGGSAFQGCSGLTSVTIPDSVTSIGEGTFWNCTGLTSITIGNGVIGIGSNAFYNCSALTSVTIPESVTSIGNQTFNNCSGLTSITIPSSVTSIGNMVFYMCSGLTSVTVDSGNTVYDSRNNCNAIIVTATNTLVQGCKTTIIPDSVTSIGDNAFNGCRGLTSITIPDSVTSIGSQAFCNCSGLTSITIPSGVTSIGERIFQGCSGFTSFTIPNSVTSIGNNAFNNCTGLTSITIGNGVTSIGSQAFRGCSSLTSIVSNATTAPTIQSYTFQNVKTGGTLYVPSGSSGYNVWMGTGNYYLGKYGWTKVVQ